MEIILIVASTWILSDLMLKKQSMRLTIVDYNAGNLFSVEQACKSVGVNPVITCIPEDMLKADALILPGVGAFGDAMKNLRKLHLVQPIKEFIAKGKPFMGVCLGMQLLFTRSEEFGEYEGLKVIDGNVLKFPLMNDRGEKIKVPQIGWNRISNPSNIENKWSGTPLEEIANGEFMYFVHSFYARPLDPKNILSVTNYDGVEYCSAVIRDNIFATQFHPEKSADKGLKIYRYWINQILGNREV